MYQQSDGVSRRRCFCKQRYPVNNFLLMFFLKTKPKFIDLIFFVLFWGRIIYKIRPPTKMCKINSMVKLLVLSWQFLYALPNAYFLSDIFVYQIPIFIFSTSPYIYEWNSVFVSYVLCVAMCFIPLLNLERIHFILTVNLWNVYLVNNCVIACIHPTHCEHFHWTGYLVNWVYMFPVLQKASSTSSAELIF